MVSHLETCKGEPNVVSCENMTMEKMKRKFNYEMGGDEFRGKVHVDYWSLDFQSYGAQDVMFMCYDNNSYSTEHNKHAFDNKPFTETAKESKSNV